MLLLPYGDCEMATSNCVAPEPVHCNVGVVVTWKPVSALVPGDWGVGMGWSDWSCTLFNSQRRVASAHTNSPITRNQADTGFQVTTTPTLQWTGSGATQFEGGHFAVAVREQQHRL